VFFSKTKNCVFFLSGRNGGSSAEAFHTRRDGTRLAGTKHVQGAPDGAPGGGEVDGDDQSLQGASGVDEWGSEEKIIRLEPVR